MNKTFNIKCDCCVRNPSEKLSKPGTKNRRGVPEEFWSAGRPRFQLVSYEYALMMNPLEILAPFKAGHYYSLKSGLQSRNNLQIVAEKSKIYTSG